jgi:hypothetical protein
MIRVGIPLRSKRGTSSAVFIVSKTKFTFETGRGMPLRGSSFLLLFCFGGFLQARRPQSRYSWGRETEGDRVRVRGCLAVATGKRTDRTASLFVCFAFLYSTPWSSFHCIVIAGS